MKNDKVMTILNKNSHTLVTLVTLVTLEYSSKSVDLANNKNKFKIQAKNRRKLIMQNQFQMQY